MPDKPFLFCFLAWMEHYRGNPKTDVPRGGGAFIDKNQYGHEILNFRREGARLYGYVSTSGRSIRIERLGAPAGSGSVSGVTVVFVATNPEVGYPVIVGWYTNATVYRNTQLPPKALRRVYNHEDLEYNLVTSDVENSFLIPVVDRREPVPGREDGGFGQSRLW